MASPEKIEAYRQTILELLPTGLAWPRREGSLLMGIVEATAEMYADIDDRVEELEREADPRTTITLFEDWEAALGLPDPCAADADTIEERRTAILTKYLSEGGQSQSYFEGLCADLGYDVTIDRYRPFQFGTSAFGGEHMMGSGTLAYHWRVQVHGPRVTRFRFGSSRFGNDSFMKLTRADDLECILHELKPAESTLIFAYQE